ncbi:glycoside hydrolase family 127 protein [Hymenobacter weizhouensis]|uniref:glycoside hydrolase family 127 protein n=1 Tax=Hymenobacter sp. YIM 151500-1 TaxID=2987689 RepID=UPI0022279A45|nr:glycoside hydrolase family 127 protein [Hymenobacter sp. YIM 151500-1]UYZ62394.1 glycoside hydrolase family 127 protein [Hymenobacter sp. YIM 151500-1]
MSFRLIHYVLPLAAALVSLRGECQTAPATPAATPGARPEAFRPGAFQALPLGAVKPEGWLKRQLVIQANGLTGHLEEFWPDLGPNSAWLGGSGEGWERGPYYLDGLLPLAYLLDDAQLKAKAQKWVDWTLQSQRPDGGIGPAKNQDWWPNMLVLKSLMQYQEATGDQRVVPFMEKYFAYQNSQMDKIPLKEWAIFRWAEELLPIRWTYQKTKNPQLLELANKLAKQGFNWEQGFAKFPFTEATNSEGLGLGTNYNNNNLALQAHGVNNAMALKMPVLWGMTGGTEADRKAIYRQLETLDQYHGLPNGMYSGDEHFAGRNPSQGVELCAVVEAQFSYEQLLALLGDPLFGDRLEKITYNALPATFDATMWAHQYDQQPNQVLVSKAKRQWSTNGDESNLFGLEPHFGCCTANMHQGWPKFASHLWMASPDGGLVAAAYAPSRLSAAVRGGETVTIREETEYPFRETIRFVVEKPAKAAFPLHLRIPAWATKAAVTVNGKPAAKAPQAGTFYVLEQAWKKGDVVELRLPMDVRVLPGFNQSVSVERGPLVYALKLSEQWTKLRDRPNQADDYEVRATTPWNYGLLLPTGGAPASAFQVKEKPTTGVLFSPEGAPIELQVKGIRLPEWQLVNNSAGPPPASPVVQPAGAKPETLTLIPYGSAKLRVTSFPVVRP